MFLIKKFNFEEIQHFDNLILKQPTWSAWAPSEGFWKFSIFI